MEQLKKWYSICSAHQEPQEDCPTWWYSICSAHQDPQEDCPRCKVGHWGEDSSDNQGNEDRQDDNNG